MSRTRIRKVKGARRRTPLSAIDLFEELPDAALRALETTSQVSEYPAGHIFFRTGERGALLYVLERGSVQTFRISGTKKLLIVELKSTAVFGEMACVGKGVYHCTAQAIETCRVRTIARGDFDRTMRNFPSVTRRLLELVGARFFHVLIDLEGTSYRGLIGRTASFLLERVEGGRVRNITHKEIADHLHVYRESATAALGELRMAGIIAIERKCIRVLDLSRLTRAARE